MDIVGLIPYESSANSIYQYSPNQFGSAVLTGNAAGSVQTSGQPLSGLSAGLMEGQDRPPYKDST